MVYRPAQVYNGSGWDDIGDKRMLTHDHSGGADGTNIPQSSVTDLTSDLASKAANPKTVDTKTANYTLILGDRDKIVQMNSTSARTITVPTNASVAFAVGTIVHVANINTGTLTIAGASGVTVSQAGGLTLAQWESGSLYQRAANAWVFLKGGGLGAANFSNASTGTYTDGGISYKYVTFTASGTLTVTKAGLADVLVVGGGGGGGEGDGRGGGGGGGDHIYLTEIYIPAGSHSLTVGGGGAKGNPGARGNYSSALGIYAVGGGGGGAHTSSSATFGASGGGGSGQNPTAGIAIVDTVTGNIGGIGATDLSTYVSSGGGGGKGGAGQDSSGAASGDGGAGVANSITGTSIGRCGGGGGNGNDSGTGTDGGGNGNGGNGTANSGGGGGGNGNGGSGVVIVRVKV